MKKTLLILSALSVLLGSILTYQNITYNDKKLHIVICDVGQGDAIFIRTSTGSDILVDGGPDDSVLNCLGKNMPFWDKTLELMVLTHPDADHITGLIDVIKRYKVIRFYTSKAASNAAKVKGKTDVYKQFLKTLQKVGIKQNYLWQGDKFTLKEGLTIETLWPTPQWKGLTTNSFSVVELLTYKNFKVLLTGDLDAEQMEEVDDLAGEINLLKVPHHGSRFGLTAEILDILNPDLAVISVGKNNRHGHPSAETLKILRDKDIKILRTDQNGEVEIISDGKTWEVN